MDILFTYTMSTKAFTTGESQTYDIGTTSGTIAAADFDFSSTCGMGCGTGGHLAAVHVQNTPNGGSGSAFVGGTIGSTPAPVPEPATLALLGTAMLGFGVLRRRAAQLTPHISDRGRRMRAPPFAFSGHEIDHGATAAFLAVVDQLG
jgi:hypothetical protein